jgi:hypothetical protein
LYEFWLHLLGFHENLVQDGPVEAFQSLFDMPSTGVEKENDGNSADASCLVCKRLFGALVRNFHQSRLADARFALDPQSITVSRSSLSRQPVLVTFMVE